MPPLSARPYAYLGLFSANAVKEEEKEDGTIQSRHSERGGLGARLRYAGVGNPHLGCVGRRATPRALRQARKHACGDETLRATLLRDPGPLSLHAAMLLNEE